MTKDEALALVLAYRAHGGTRRAIVLRGGNLGIDIWEGDDGAALAFWRKYFVPLDDAGRAAILKALAEVPA
ncbi:MAG: hypothetical protein KUA43_08805 [Hoeflea sp.]|uniref:hypothetical protein n=1 Tax=Hoeflea sp. TaxID=1940281 RepID=UPI001E0C1B06|nr:hypothetical protein [Hoeflea sp.]MBU4529764.1 hypothetical protein [Alphaproteobacteria bacterium]MBU4543325.1 hypothetical protein [Alphaproteobacteria bacterium]MBU4552512.1 hypothetical protein [Alphaproteobacteria bacterium]MBV1723528.1 hypothetical protein [Hoeflea sp.]MBV1762977.1 hypothetical protein [Hoeflea sp.]